MNYDGQASHHCISATNLGKAMSTETNYKPFKISCPGCQKNLRIEDPRLLGKKVKCPRCKNPFLLELPAVDTNSEKPAPAQVVKPQQIIPLAEQAPSSAEIPVHHAEEEIQLELVTDELPVGTSAKWVPDPPAASAPRQPVSAPSPVSTTTAFPNFSGSSAGSPLITPEGTEAQGRELNRLRSRRQKGWGPTLIVGMFLVLGLGTVGFLVTNYKPKPKSPEIVAGGLPPENLEEPVNANEPYSRERLAYKPELVQEFDPTSGNALSLAMMPRGVTFVVHLRPALLWSSGRQYQELKASLTEDVTNWIATKLKEVTRRDPEQIEEVYLGFILGAGGSEPEVCAVVHLKEAAKLSDLIDEFKGEYVYDITERPDLRLKRDDKYAYLIKDASTFAIAPALYAAELEEAQTQPYVLSVPMENLLRETDRQRLITTLGIVRDLRLHYPKLVPESAHVAFEQYLNWIGEDVEAVSWSLHPEPYFHSEMKLHPISASNPPKVNTRIQAQFHELPEVLWKNLCVRMSPRELRFRNFIGRLPAMMEAFRESTISFTTANFVAMTTILPAKAAPNLALATLFTVNEAARTDFTADVIVAANDQPKLPDTIVERLRIPVDSEFSRRPLEMALKYLCDEIEVNLEVDGDALKDAGYTKNMPQTFNLGIVPVERSFAEIVNTYQEPGKIMVMSIDEKTKTIHILTEKFALQKNLPIYKFKKE